MNSDPKDKLEASSEEPSSPASIEQELEKHLSSIKVASERHSVVELTRDLMRLPLDEAAAAIETGVSIASISLRASIEFLRAAPEVAKVLAPPELRAWGEMGRRLAMSDLETAVSYFVAGVEDLQNVPKEVRGSLFQLCARQMTLSSPIGIETLRKAGALATTIRDTETLRSVLEIAAEISRRSAKHSADFLAATPKVMHALNQAKDSSLREKALALASGFAARAGGIAADAWISLPTAIENLRSEEALQLLDRTDDFLERGGGGALHVMLSGGEILRGLPEIFEDWIDLLYIVAQHGNASLVAFVRSTPRFIRGF